jgi:DNA topoisomerase IB
MSGSTRLRRSAVRSPGIRRLRRGKGFSYLTTDEVHPDEGTLTRIKDLVIPPAWKNVWICPYPNGHIQAVGTDAAGRRQYLYHEQWRRSRDEEKHDRVLAMAACLPRWRAEVDKDLRGRGFGRQRVLAAALRMLDRGIFRTGGEEYAEENGTHGVATLLREHTRVRGSEVWFGYPAKGGIAREVSIDDRPLAVALKGLLRAGTGSDRLLCYRTGKEWHEVRADDVNARFKEIAGEDCTAKDLRTWHATVLAATAFATTEPATSARACAKQVTAVMREVADALGNTPAVCRASYVDPRVVEAYRDGRTIASAARRARKLDDEDARAAVEKAVIRLLKR